MTRSDAINNALARARTHAAAGLTAEYMRTQQFGSLPPMDFYRVPSATRDREYTVVAQTTPAGTYTVCGCEAADKNIICWHRAAVQLAIRA